MDANHDTRTGSFEIGRSTARGPSNRSPPMRRAGKLSSSATRPPTGSSTTRSARLEFIAGRRATSRRPRRENIAFYPTWADAERAGFRACRKCHPKRADQQDSHTALVVDACRRIEGAEKAPSLAELAKVAGLSPWHFQRVFKRVTGVTPKAYAAQQQAGRIRAGLGGTPSATRAIFAAGFSSTGRFYEQSRQLLGMTPKAFRQGGAGTEICFAVGECSLGAILVAATDLGVLRDSTGRRSGSPRACSRGSLSSRRLAGC